MFTEYIKAALKHAKYVALEDDTYMATIEGLRGAIAIGDTIEDLPRGSHSSHRRLDNIGVEDGSFNSTDRWPYYRRILGADVRCRIRCLFPVSRRELIRRLAKLGFDGPYIGSGHK
ncbi:MAG: hypothetical protein MUO26_14710 [Methanotrichaceae archaeon]|nr:hypothetical protein [Methanotrichaceae archaeon]